MVWPCDQNAVGIIGDARPAGFIHWKTAKIYTKVQVAAFQPLLVMPWWSQKNYVTMLKTGRYFESTWGYPVTFLRGKAGMKMDQSMKRNMYTWNTDNM